ncbi:MAG: hypothetical protein AAF739_11235 [Pseudomonadota bacterium]
MRTNAKIVVTTALICIGLGHQAVAQQAAEFEAGCLVTHLNPSGEGFLSIRRGPGTQHQEIARVHNGDALFIDTRRCQGDWCYAEGGSVNDQRVKLTGWFHTGWCEMYP